MRLSACLEQLETLAPPALSADWDNTGLLLGDRTSDVAHVLTCLTLSSDVAAEAVAVGVQLVVTHHPLMFQPIQRVTGDTVEGEVLLSLSRAGIAVYSPHTAWDNAPLGINQQLAELCGLTDIRPLRLASSAKQVKLVTFVPRDSLEAVQRALWNAGCGVIEDYRECSFVLHGTGTFRGGEDSNPSVGVAGRLEHVEEARLDVICPSVILDTAVAALRRAHPYEEPVFDIFPLHVLPGDQGAGRWGRLPSPLTLSELSQRIQQRLGASGLQFAGEGDAVVEHLGIACGAAAEFWKDARRAAARRCSPARPGFTPPSNVARPGSV